jgi:hypothetical protein
MIIGAPSALYCQAILDNAAGPCPDGKNAALQCVRLRASQADLFQELTG